MTDELPTGWEIAPLGELLTEGPTNGYSPESTPTATGTLTLKLSATTTGALILDENTTKRIVERMSDDSKFWLRPGDILVQRANSLEYVGTAAIYDGPLNTYIYPDLMMRLRPRDELVKAAYLWQFINSREAKAYLRDRATGTAGNMPKISGATLRELPVMVPPLNEQLRIVAKIEALTAKSRRAKEALNAIPALLDRFRQSVLAAAFRGDLTADWREKNPDVEPAEELLKRIRAERRRRWEEAELAKMRAKGKVPGDDRWKEKYEEPAPVDASELPGLPEGWCWTTASEICDRVVDCHNKTAPYERDGILLLRTSNIRDGELVLDDVRYVSESTYEFWSRRCPPAAHDVLFTREAPMAEAAMVPPGLKVCMGQRMMLLRGERSALTPFYLLLACQSPYIKEWADREAVGTGVKHLRVGDVERMPLPLCSMSEQVEVVRRLEGLLRRQKSTSSTFGELQELHSTLQKAILAKAFRGELVPQDPNDEPAFVLLERLRAEREKSGKTTNGSGRRRTSTIPRPASSNPTALERKPHASRRSQAPARSRG
ncbi:restriction endonuclease subunit S [Sorangium sp. So ce315]|uniref:restriction endonuclease subunit S n=1 Tax=Sorangium sp. So ce315 TaxID=3133299 RepID=UPI003F608CDE